MESEEVRKWGVGGAGLHSLGLCVQLLWTATALSKA